MGSVTILRLKGGKATTEQPLTVSITLDPLSADLVIRGVPKILVSTLNTISQFSVIHHASSQMVNNESTLTVNTKYNSERTTGVQYTHEYCMSTILSALLFILPKPFYPENIQIRVTEILDRLVGMFGRRRCFWCILFYHIP